MINSPIFCFTGDIYWASDYCVEDFVQHEVGLKLNAKHGFSIYFILSRVLHPLLSSPQRPRFNAKINELAKLVQESMEYRPGYGSNVL